MPGPECFADGFAHQGQTLTLDRAHVRLDVGLGQLDELECKLDDLVGRERRLEQHLTLLTEGETVIHLAHGQDVQPGKVAEDGHSRTSSLTADTEGTPGLT